MKKKKKKKKEKEKEKENYIINIRYHGNNKCLNSHYNFTSKI